VYQYTITTDPDFSDMQAFHKNKCEFKKN
jgi:hypothetical protein